MQDWRHPGLQRSSKLPTIAARPSRHTACGQRGFEQVDRETGIRVGDYERFFRVGMM